MLGNAEVNVIFNAWNLHLMLCENAAGFWRKSMIAQIIIWVLALLTTATAIAIVSLGHGPDPKSSSKQLAIRLPMPSPECESRPSSLEPSWSWLGGSCLEKRAFEPRRAGAAGGARTCDMK